MEFDNVDTPERENRIECNGCLEPKKAGELSWVKTEGHNRYAVSILSILFITSSLQSCSHTWLTSQELFRNALGIHRVPYGSIGKHNGQRWTPGVRENIRLSSFSLIWALAGGESEGGERFTLWLIRPVVSLLRISCLFKSSVKRRPGGSRSGSLAGMEMPARSCCLSFLSPGCSSDCPQWGWDLNWGGGREGGGWHSVTVSDTHCLPADDETL